MSNQKLNANSARSASASGLRGKPSDCDGLVLWRQNWLASSRPEEIARSKSASSWIFAAWASTGSLTFPQKVILPRAKDFAISVVDLRVASEKSNLSGKDLGCVDFTAAFHSLAVREHEERCLAFQIDGVWYTYRVIPFGLASSPLLWERVPSVLPRVGQSMFQAEELRAQMHADGPRVGLSRTASPPACPFGHAFVLGSHGREPLLEERQMWPRYWLDRQHDHRPPTPWFQCSADGNPLARTRKTPGPHQRSPAQKRTRGRQRSFTCRWSPRLGRWSLPMAPDFELGSLIGSQRIGASISTCVGRQVALCRGFCNEAGGLGADAPPDLRRDQPVIESQLAGSPAQPMDMKRTKSITQRGGGTASDGCGSGRHCQHENHF